MLCGEQNVSPTAHFSIKWCIPIEKWLYQVNKNIKLTYKSKQLKWRCRNDATIYTPKVELWFQLQHCWAADFEVVYTFELMTQPSENCSGAENR